MSIGNLIDQLLTTLDSRIEFRSVAFRRGVAQFSFNCDSSKVQKRGTYDLHLDKINEYTLDSIKITIRKRFKLD